MARKAIARRAISGQEQSLPSSPSGSIVTGNVTLFPKALTLFARQDVYERSSAVDRRILRSAAADTVRYAVADNVTDSGVALGFSIEGRRIVLATPEDLARLRREAAPVYCRLEQDGQTRRFIARIRTLQRTTPPDPPLDLPAACALPVRPARAVGPPRPAGLLNGTYRWVITEAEARASHGGRGQGIPSGPNPGDVFPMISTSVLRNGVGKVSGPDHDGGTYTIRGTAVTFDRLRVAGVLVFRFRREANGTIRWTPVLPMDPGDRFVWASQPWRRIGPPTTLPN